MPGIGAAAAYRWKCQLNENAKVPAFAAELPEAGHNEIVGWEDARVVRALRGGVPRGPRRGRAAAARIELTAEIVGGEAAHVERVAPRGDSRPSAWSRSCCSATSCRSTSPCCAAPTRSTSSRSTRVQRLVSHVALGDLVSLYAAVLRGADPIGIEPIDRLKAWLAAR